MPTITKNQLLQKVEDQYNISNKVDVVSIANELGIEVFGNNTKDNFNASIIFNADENKFKIYINQTQSVQRQRFSVAHELAHYVLHGNDIKEKGQIDRSEEKTEQEIDADKFAAEILMPQNGIQKYLSEENIKKENPVDTNLIMQVAQHFNVSKFVALLRLRSLGLYVPYITFE